MGVSGKVPVLDTPENRDLWLSDFRSEELRDFLRTLLDVGFAQMILKNEERGFCLTTLGRMRIETFSKQPLSH